MPLPDHADHAGRVLQQNTKPFDPSFGLQIENSDGLIQRGTGFYLISFSVSFYSDNACKDPDIKTAEQYSSVLETQLAKDSADFYTCYNHVGSNTVVVDAIIDSNPHDLPLGLTLSCNVVQAAVDLYAPIEKCSVIPQQNGLAPYPTAGVILRSFECTDVDAMKSSTCPFRWTVVDTGITVGTCVTFFLLFSYCLGQHKKKKRQRRETEQHADSPYKRMLDPNDGRLKDSRGIYESA
ncbi:hypothetical protein ScalyP_jg7578 [Parmales sp. scaly parma]|jgi:hypothetical protein|nr:hypothetical protein ScalyP_jg7578 [Parmales sp. scaly parma]